MKLSIENIINAIDGKVLNPHYKADSGIAGISIDTRTINENDLFIAIKGERYDGHDFINEALKKGARVFIVNEFYTYADIEKSDEFCFIGVKDTKKALGDIANFKRRNLNVKIAAITGSCGKTTAKNMAYSVLSRKFSAFSNKGNFNNDIGLPLTFLNLDKNYEWGVVELGINHIGEMKRLTDISEPDIGVILNIGAAHIEGLGSIEGVAEEKGELLSGIKKNGTAILNADDFMTNELLKKNKCEKTIFFGLSDKADIRASNIKKENMKTSFTLETPLGEILITLSIYGSFMVLNALAAASVGFCAGLSNDEIKKGLENFIPQESIMNIIEKNGVTIIDDTYNSNPLSLKAAIDEFGNIRGRKFLVLGDMLELGKDSEKYHYDIGTFAAKKDISVIFITGAFKGFVKSGALDAGFLERNIFCGTKEEIVSRLKKFLKPYDYLLIKGSRAARMEDIIKGLEIK